MEFTVTKLSDNFYSLDQRGVRAFLFVGEDAAILVDTCFGGDIKAACEAITDKPITLITTHADPDHMGCDGQFPKHYLHEAEFPRYESRNNSPVTAKPLAEGDIITTGDYSLEVVLIPGHTPGSIALLDRQHKFLVSGDTVQDSCIFMHGEGRDLQAFRGSIQKLDRMRQKGLFDTVYASHGTVSLPADVLTDHLALADAVLTGTAEPVGPAPDWFPETVKTYGWGRVKMYYEYK